MWPGFPRNQDFAEDRGLEPKIKMSEEVDACNKVVCLKRITNGGLGRGAPSRWAIFCTFQRKIAILMPLSHIWQVFREIRKNKIFNIESQLKNLN